MFLRFAIGGFFQGNLSLLAGDCVVKNYDEIRVEHSLEHLRGHELVHSENVGAVEDAVRGMKLDEMESATVRSFLSCMKRLAPFLDEPVLEMSREGIEDLALAVSQEEHDEYGPYSAWTRADDKAALQSLFKYGSDREQDVLFRNVRLTPKASDRSSVDPQQLLNPSEAEELVASVDHARDRCFLGMLWDSGMRRKEIAELEWRDIIPSDKNIFQVHVRNGKNGGRTVPLHESGPLIESWFSKYPDPLGSDPVWISKRGWSKEKKKISPRSLRDIVDRAEEDARVPQRRKLNLHAWRKARATDLAGKGMNQPAMEQYFGWCRGSRMPRIYIQLASVDLENQIRDIYGLDRKEKQHRELGEELEEYAETR